MKIYARQVNPEQQESPLFSSVGIEECYPDTLIMPGNRQYRAHNTDFPAWRMVVDYFDEMAQEWEDAGAYYTRNPETGYTLHRPARKPITLQELLHDYKFTSPTGKPWTTRERGEWRKLMESGLGGDSPEIYLPALRLLTGYDWEEREINGCSQGDWADIIIRADAWSDEAIECFETEYFNTGTEWVIHDGTEDPEDPEEISGYCQYCHSWNNEGIRQEIADAAGHPDAEVVLYEWAGYTKVDRYTVAD